jgi:hypothetical protein
MVSAFVITTLDIAEVLVKFLVVQEMAQIVLVTEVVMLF